MPMAERTMRRIQKVLPLFGVGVQAACRLLGLWAPATVIILVVSGAFLHAQPQAFFGKHSSPAVAVMEAQPQDARPAQARPSPQEGVILQSSDNQDAAYQAAMARRAARLDKITAVTDEMLQHPPDGDWLT